MANFNMQITNRGRALQAKAQAGTPLVFTRMRIGSGSMSGQQIADMTALIDPKLWLSINKSVASSSGRYTVGAYLSSNNVTTGFYFREWGVFAQDPDLGEILYCYGNVGAGAEYIAAGGGSDAVEKQLDAITIIGNAANVSAVLDESLVFPSRREFEDHKEAEVLDHPDGSVTTAKLANGAATDDKIGNRTISDATAPTSNTEKLTGLLSGLANMIKSITGGATWRTVPGMTIAAIKTILDAATNAATANTLIKRDANGRAKVTAPSATDDIARKAEVDAAISTAAADATSKANAAQSAAISAAASDATSKANAAQAAAISAAASDATSKVDEHASDTVKHITASERTNWNAKETTTGAQSKANAARDAAISAASSDATSKANAVQSNLNSHANDNVKHITATERTAWNNKENAGVAQSKADAALNAAKDYAVNAVAIGSSADPNTTEDSYILTNHANSPRPGGNYCHIYTFFYSSKTWNRAQLAVQYNGGDSRLYTRSCFGDVWTEWKEFAPLNSPVFTGNVAVGDGVTIASRAFELYLGFKSSIASSPNQKMYIEIPAGGFSGYFDVIVAGGYSQVNLGGDITKRFYGTLTSLGNFNNAASKYVSTSQYGQNNLRIGEISYDSASNKYRIPISLVSNIDAGQQVRVFVKGYNTWHLSSNIMDFTQATITGFSTDSTALPVPIVGQGETRFEGGVFTNAGSIQGGSIHVSMENNGSRRFAHALFGAETSNDGGANYGLYSYSNSGNYLGTVYTINRASQVFNFIKSPTVPTPANDSNNEDVPNTSWVKATIGRDTRAQQIPTGANLNDYLDEGQYVTFSTAIANSVLNRPFDQNGAFNLEVKRGAYAWKHQIVTYISGLKFERWYNGDGSSWQGWKAILTTDTIPDTASQADAEGGTDNTKMMTPFRVRQAIDSINRYGVTAGTATALTVTLTPSITELKAGLEVKVKLHTNTGTNPTLKVNGFGAFPMYAGDGTSRFTGVTGRIYTFIYDGTAFILASGGGWGTGDVVPLDKIAIETGNVATEVWANTEVVSGNDVAVDSSGNVYSAHISGKQIRKLNSLGEEVWANTDVGSGNAVAVDTSGNVYAANGVLVGSKSVRKLSSSGSEIWAKTDAGVANDIAVDSSGNVYVAHSSSKQIRKLNSSGTELWAKTDVDSGQGVAVDSTGNVYAANSVALGGKAVRKLNSSGTEVWAKTDVANARSIAVDSSGNVYTAHNVTTGDKVLRKLDPSGSEIWAITNSSSFDAVTADDAGYAYAVSGTTGAQVRKFGRDGTEVWRNGGMTLGKGVAVDSSGNVYTAHSGTTTGAKYIRKLSQNVLGYKIL